VKTHTAALLFSRTKNHWILLLILFGAICIHLPTLNLFPKPYSDEAWFAARGWYFAHIGVAFSTIDSGVIDKYPGYWSVIQWLPALILSLPLRFMQSPDLFPLRLISLAFGMVLIIFVYLLGSYFGGKKLAILSSILAVLSLPFFISSHLARPDIYLAVAGLGAFTIFFYSSKDRKWWKDILIGLIPSVACEIHLNAFIYIVTLFVLYLYHFRRKQLGKENVGLFLLGCILGLAFFHLQLLIFSGTHTPPIFKPDIFSDFQDAVDFIILFVYSHLYAIPMLLWSISEVFKNRRKLMSGDIQDNENELHLLNIVMLASRILWIRNWGFFYNIYYQPVLEIVFSAFTINILGAKTRKPFQRSLNSAVVTILVISSIVFSIARIDLTPSNAYDRIVAGMGSVLREGDRLLGEPTYWFGLYRYDYLVWEQLRYYQKDHPGSGLEQAFRELEINVFILDDQLSQFISDQPLPDYQESLKLSASELNLFLQNHGKVIFKVDDRDYGEIIIYRLFQENQ
jgi:4-amino-4-deoxy-L-arabinose transferase-like glycosyltransferase